MINPVLEIIYRLLKKAIAADHMAEMVGYIAEAMTVIEKILKQNS